MMCEFRLIHSFGIPEMCVGGRTTRSLSQLGKVTSYAILEVGHSSELFPYASADIVFTRCKFRSGTQLCTGPVSSISRDQSK